MTPARRKRRHAKPAKEAAAAAPPPADPEEPMFTTDDQLPAPPPAADDQGAPPGDDGADDAFEAARDKLAGGDDQGGASSNGATPSSARVRTENDRRLGRWRSRNLRRKRAGEEPLTEAEQVAADQEAGIVPEAPASHDAAPGHDVPVARRERQTRAQLEAEVAQLRAKVDVEERAFLARALGETARTAWDVVRRFTPSTDRELSDAEVTKLGDAWAPVLAPKMAALATAAPWMIAASVTFRIVAPRVESALTEPKAAAPTVAAGSASSRVSMDPAREVAPPVPAPPVMDRAPGSEGFPVPAGADPTAFGYSPSADAP